MSQDSSPTPPDIPRGRPQVSSRSSGQSAVEAAAKRGIGPLSPEGMKVWHGQACPCVSCGELVRRSEMHCVHCGQDLSFEMITRMQAHAGPWYVHEHIRPFPGVTLERLIRQARRGVLTATTIVRGPTTHHQWRFAAETPALSKHVGLCWNCQASVKDHDTYCKVCDVHLDFPPGEAPPGSPATAAPEEAAESELDRLSTVLRAVPVAARGGVAEGRRRRIPVSFVIACIVVAAVAVLVVVVKLRERSRAVGLAPEAPLVESGTRLPGTPGGK